MKTISVIALGHFFKDLRIDYCDERLVYSNGDISVTKGSTYTNNTSIKSPDVSLFNDIT